MALLFMESTFSFIDPLPTPRPVIITCTHRTSALLTSYTWITIIMKRVVWKIMYFYIVPYNQGIYNHLEEDKIVFFFLDSKKYNQTPCWYCPKIYPEEYAIPIPGNVETFFYMGSEALTTAISIDASNFSVELSFTS